MSTLHLVMLLFGSFLVYTVAIFVVTPHSFVTLHHHKLVRPRVGRDFPQTGLRIFQFTKNWTVTD